jgi:hypothetical protein
LACRAVLCGVVWWVVVLMFSHLMMRHFKKVLVNVPYLSLFPTRPTVLPFLASSVPLLQPTTPHVCSFTTNTPNRMIRTTKAAVVDPVGQPPKIKDVPVTEPATNQTQIKVIAAGLHQLVRSRASGKHYSVGTNGPVIPGMINIILYSLFVASPSSTLTPYR